MRNTHQILVPFSIASRVGVSLILEHDEIQEIPDIFGRGLRQIKDVAITHVNGICFVDLNLESCTESDKSFVIHGHIYEKKRRFSFVAHSQDPRTEVKVIFRES